MLSEQLGDGDYFRSAEPWNHKLDGVFIAAGEGIDETAALERAHLFDVAPTVMAAMDVPYSDRMDGSVVPVVDPIESTSYPEYDTHDDGHRPATDEAVTDRLADLGYMN